MISSRHGNHTFNFALLLQDQEFVQRSSIFEGGCELKVLELEIEISISHRRQSPRLFESRIDSCRGNTGGSCSDVFECQCHGPQW